MGRAVPGFLGQFPQRRFDGLFRRLESAGRKFHETFPDCYSIILHETNAAIVQERHDRHRAGMANDVLGVPRSVGRFLRHAFHAEPPGLVKHLGRLHVHLASLAELLAQ